MLIIVRLLLLSFGRGLLVSHCNNLFTTLDSLGEENMIPVLVRCEIRI